MAAIQISDHLNSERLTTQCPKQLLVICLNGIIVASTFAHENMPSQNDNTMSIYYKKPSELAYSRIHYTGKWGFNVSGCPYANNCSTHRPNETIDFKFGLYRASDTTQIQARYSSLKVGNSFEAVNPACNNSPNICQGDYSDTDNDNVCDAEDRCPEFDDNLIGTACDDGDPCTYFSVYDSNCNCTPIYPQLNHALSGTPTFSSGNLANAVLLNDGIIDNSLLANTGNATPNEWMQIDLGNSQQIDDVVIWNRTNCCGDRLNNAYVLVSNTPFPNNTDLNAALANAEFTYQLGDVSLEILVTINVSQTGRYVRLQKSGDNNADNYLNILEFQVLRNTIPIDTDSDGICDDVDICQGFDDNLDQDNDNLPDGCDNCLNYLSDLSNSNISTGIYQVGDYIKNNGIIMAPVNVSFKAGSYIELTNDFEVMQGAEFEAKIEGCQ